MSDLHCRVALALRSVGPGHRVSDPLVTVFFSVYSRLSFQSDRTLVPVVRFLFVLRFVLLPFSIRVQVRSSPTSPAKTRGWPEVFYPRLSKVTLSSLKDQPVLLYISRGLCFILFFHVR